MGSSGYLAPDTPSAALAKVYLVPEDRDIMVELPNFLDLFFLNFLAISLEIPNLIQRHLYISLIFLSWHLIVVEKLQKEIFWFSMKFFA